MQRERVFYKVEIDGTYNSVPMTNTEGSTFQGSIPAGADGDNLYFFVQAYDTWEDLSVHYSMLPSDTSRGLYGYTVRAGGQLEISDIEYTPYADGNSRFDGYEVTITGTVMDSFDVALNYGYPEFAAYYLQSGTTPEWNSIISQPVPPTQSPLGVPEWI